MKRTVLSVLGVWTLLLLCAGVAGAGNLLVNGDFSQGNTGFTTDYTYVPGNGTIHTENGDYSVIANPATAFTNGYASYGDHTTGSGLMLFADSDGPGHNIWSENVSVGAGSYTFTGWVANADIPLQNPATLSLFINGAETGNTFTITQTGGIWEEWTVQLNFDSASNIDLSIQDLNTNFRAAGDDFTLDDLSLAPGGGTTPEPSSLLLTGSGFMTVAVLFRRRLLGR